VKQDVKYAPGTAGAAAQRWRFSSTGISVLDKDKFTITNEAFPGKVLQPAANSLSSGVPVVLGTPGGAGIHSANRWVVTSPLLASDGQLHT